MTVSHQDTLKHIPKHMKVNNMKELCQYAEKKRKARKHHHIEMVMLYGTCSGMGNRRYKLPQKQVFRKKFYTN